MGFKPTIFVISNNGYTIERVIHGPHQRYNEISTLWDHQGMLRFFGAKDAANYSAKSTSELTNVLKNESFFKNGVIQLCELFLDQYDSPWRLTKQMEYTQAVAKKKLDKRDKETCTERVTLA